MADLTYYPYGSNPLPNIQRDLEHYRAGKVRRELEIKQLHEELKVNPPAEVISKIVMHLKNNNKGEYLTKQFANEYTAQHQRRLAIDGRTNEYNTIISKITELVAKQQGLSNNQVTINTSMLNEMLTSTCPEFYVPNSAVAEIDNTRPQLRWNLQGIHFKPDANYYHNVFNATMDFQPIPLPPVTMAINPTLATITVKHSREDRSVMDAFHGYCRPHPHIMGGHGPCLGGFENGTTSMFMCHDIATLNHIMIMFLQHASSDDWAAANWPMWLYNHSHEKPTAHTVQLRIKDIAWTIRPVVFANYVDNKIVMTLKACIYANMNVTCTGDAIPKDTLATIYEEAAAVTPAEKRWWETVEVINYGPRYFNFLYPEVRFNE